jgi:hypothetical protein
VTVLPYDLKEVQGGENHFKELGPISQSCFIKDSYEFSLSEKSLFNIRNALNIKRVMIKLSIDGPL